jgi:hypothetical protein
LVRLPLPWEKLVDPVDRMIADTRADIGKPGLGFDTVQTAGLDQRVEQCRCIATLG